MVMFDGLRICTVMYMSKLVDFKPLFVTKYALSIRGSPKSECFSEMFGKNRFWTDEFLPFLLEKEKQVK